MRQQPPPAANDAPPASKPARRSTLWRAADSSIIPAARSALRSLEWVGRAENLAIAGASGTGKTHFVEALVHAVIGAGIDPSSVAQRCRVVP